MYTFISGRFAARVRYILIICCIPVIGTAQTLSLYDAVNKAVVNYPLIQQRQAEVAASRAHVHTVAGNRLPSFTLQDQLDLGTANAVQGSYFPLGIMPSGSGLNVAHNDPNPGNIAISFLQWDIFNFGYYGAQQVEAEKQLAVTEATMNSDKYLLTQSMVSLYLNWLKKYRLLQIQSDNMQRAQVILTAIRANVLSGLKPGVDSATAGAAYADARIAYLQALDDYNYDKIAMTVYTGLTDGIVPDTAFATDILLQNPLWAKTTDSVPVSHPLLEVYEKQYEQQVAGNNVISKKYMPRLSFDGAAWVRNSGISPTGVYPDNIAAGMPYSRYNYLLGLTVTYNLFDLKHRRDQLTEGKYTAQARQSSLQVQQLALDRMMQQANARYTITLEKLKQVPIQLYAARQAYTQQMALYRSGLNTLIEVTNAQYALQQAETNYVNTQDELLQLIYVRAGLSGQADIFLQNSKR